MRITTKTLSRRVLNNLNNVYGNLDKYHTQASTGDRFQRASDDPVNAIRTMDVQIKIDRANQYASNIAEAKAVFKEAESSYNSMTESFRTIKTCLNKGLNGSYNDEDKQGLANAIETEIDTIVAQLNKEYAGKHIFGGFNTFERPFKVTAAGDITYNNVSIETMTAAEFDAFSGEKLIVRTGKATEIDTSLPGIELTGSGPDSLFSVLKRVCTNLRDPAATRTELEDLNTKVIDFSVKVENFKSIVGTKTCNVESMNEQNESVKGSLDELLSRVSGVEYEEAIINFKISEMVYNSALMASSKIIQPTLVDFLR
jgi:flagellar hook-associated protein 3 FlgL